MSYYIDFFAPSTDYLRLVGIARLGVALAEYDARKNPAVVKANTLKFDPTSKEGYLEQLARFVFPFYMKGINLRNDPGEDLYPWVNDICSALEKDCLIAWEKPNDRWIFKRTERGNRALQSPPPPPSISRVDSAIQLITQLTYCMKYEPTVRGDPRSYGQSLTPKGVLEWIAHLGVEDATFRTALLESCTRGLVLALPGDFTSFGFEFDHRYTITSNGEIFLGRGPETDLITAAVAVANYCVSRGTLQRLLKAGSIKTYRPKRSAKNSPNLFRRQDIANRFPSRG